MSNGGKKENPKEIADRALTKGMCHFIDKAKIDGLGRREKEWLLRRFRTNFEKAFATNPEWWNKGDRMRVWLMRCTGLLARKAMELAAKRNRKQPSIKDLKDAVAWISKRACQAVEAAPRGVFCKP